MFQRFWARHPRLADALIAAVYAVPELSALIVGLAIGQVQPAIGAFQLVLSSAAAVALLFRRRRPLVALAAALAAVVLPIGAEVPSIAPIAVMIAIASVAVFRSSRDAWIALAGSVLVIAVATLLARPGNLFEAFGGAVALVMFPFVATLIGVNIGNRRRYVAALVDRAAQLVRERDQQAQLAAAAERTRIARDLHDIVAHSLTVMVRLADGADAVAERDPEAARGAVRAIASTGRSSLAEMRRLIGVLRDGEADAGPAAAADGGVAGAAQGQSAAGLAPLPTLDRLPELIASYRAAGLPVRLEATGDRVRAEGAQLAVYRGVQEGLTNALRYARHPREVLVRLEYSGVRVEVADDGAGPAPGTPVPAAGPGRGLIGMAERAALYGGTVTSGPRRDGPGWRVVMTLPEAREDES